MKEQTVATVCIHKAGDMTKEQRKDVADWLRQRAKDLMKEGHNYSTRFRSIFSFLR